jgi:hypothetical protein
LSVDDEQIACILNRNPIPDIATQAWIETNSQTSHAPSQGPHNMPPPGPQLLGFVLAVTLVAVAVGFAYRQWLAGRDRDDNLSDADRVYFASQDVRRLIGSATMFVMALAMSAGLLIQPRAGRTEFRIWVILWIGVLALAGFLLILALVDWYSVRIYAGRHRRALLAERLEAIRTERRRLAERHGPGRSPERN